MIYVVFAVGCVLLFLLRKWGENQRHTGKWSGGTMVMFRILMFMLGLILIGSLGLMAIGIL